MQFYQASDSRGITQLTDLLSQPLDRGNKVLWFLSGGSNIPIATQIMTSLSDRSLRDLTIMLSDERYGAAGHSDSNAQQLQSAGFSPKDAIFIPVLIDKPLDETVERYTQQVRREIERHQFIIGQLGIGSDGHTAGILPNSPATTVTDALVSNYEAEDFNRITLTFPALRHLTIAVVFAYGPSKQAALKQLKDESLPIEVQPAQILKAIPDSYIYNDELEGVA